MGYLKNIRIQGAAESNATLLSLHIRHWFFAVLIIALEIFLLNYFKNGFPSIHAEYNFRQYLDKYGYCQFWLAVHSLHFFKIALYALVLSLTLMVSGQSQKSSFYVVISEYQVELRTAALNLISFGALIAMLILVNNPKALIARPYSLVALAFTASPVLWLIYFGSVVNFLVPFKSFCQWILKNRVLATFVIVATVLTVHHELIEGVINFWSNLLLQPTIDFALSITSAMGLDTQLIPNGNHGPLLDTGRFLVEILPECSGYEGMALMIALLGAYCFLQRDQLRIYRALLIIPLASLTMFFLNGVRIAILIAIGHFYSPQLAIDGFHVVGGWLNVLIVFIASLIALNSITYFLKNPQLPKIEGCRDLPFLLPLSVLITVGLFDKIFATNFDWMYPVPFFFTILIIFYKRVYLASLIEKTSFSAYIIGVSTFFLWIFLIPEDTSKSQVFFNEIAGAPLGVALFWLACRVLGATIIVPIAEELAFRGFALPNLEIWLVSLLEKFSILKLSAHNIRFTSTLLSLILTSILFGVLHSEFLAGTLAGIAYGIAYLSRRKLIDAVVAHVVTNGLLAIYVVSFGYWSYW